MDKKKRTFWIIAIVGIIAALLAAGSVGVGLSKDEEVSGHSENNDGVVGWTGASDKSGVFGHSDTGVGVTGRSKNNGGVVGWTGASDKYKSGVFGWSDKNGRGVVGRSDNNDGVVGWTGASDKSGVFGHSDTGVGVTGRGDKSGVFGHSDTGVGVTGRGGEYGGYFTTNKGGTQYNCNAGVKVTTTHNYSDGVHAFTSSHGSTGVHASTTGDWSDGVKASTTGDLSDGVKASTDGIGSTGVHASTTGDWSDGVKASTTGDNSNGVHASTTGDWSDGVKASTTGDNSNGVDAFSDNGYGVYSYSSKSDGVQGHGYTNGVYGESWSDYGQGVFGVGTGEHTEGVIGLARGSGYGVYGQTTSEDHRYGVYTDDYMYALDYKSGGGDVAEYFPVNGTDIEAGTVMVIDEAGSAKLRRSTNAHDTRVAGIVSTSSGMSLGVKEGGNGNEGEKLIAIAGRVPCKVDASYAQVMPGDLLTTSDTPGHAMKAINAQIGTILGKALEPMDNGTGVIEVLVTLQ